MQNLEGFLGKIYPEIQKTVAARKQNVSLEEMKEKAEERTLPPVDVCAIAQKNDAPISIIAEIKKASPSAGDISTRDITEQAKTYHTAGAIAISVLTEEHYFKGSPADLTQCKTLLPDACFLRKDFTVNPYQVYEAKAMGADMILLITKWLEDKELHDLYDTAKNIGLRVLVETESVEDLKRAEKLNADVIGINARNLTDLSVDPMRVPELAETLAQKPSVFVGESGVKDADTVRQWQKAGINTILIGETLMRAENPQKKLKELSLQ